MMKIMALVIAAAAVCVGIPDTAEADSGDFAKELGGLEFGVAREQAGELVKAETRGALQFYKRPGRRKDTYHDVALGDVLYGFRDDKLEVVELWTRNIFCSGDLLKGELVERFGEPVYSTSSNEAWRQSEAECSRHDPADCDIAKFEGFPRDPNAKGLIGWYTAYRGIKGTNMCAYRVRFSPSPRTRAERDKASKALPWGNFPVKKKSQD